MSNFARLLAAWLQTRPAAAGHAELPRFTRRSNTPMRDILGISRETAAILTGYLLLRITLVN